MKTRSKPVRIFANDDVALEQIARILGHSRAAVMHKALAEYVMNHREELTRVYDETQQALAAGDLDQLVRASAAARQAEADQIMADIPA